MAMKSWSAGDKVLAADLNANFLGAQQNLGYGTSGEAFSVGQALYVKASDGRLYKAVGTGDESTYSFVGLAASASTGAAQAVTFAKAGGMIELSSLTAGSYYYITDTAGTIDTTPGTRYAKIGQALSTTTFRIIEPRFVRKGTVSITATGDYAVTTGFYPARIRILGARSATASQGSVGSDTNECTRWGQGASAPSSSYVSDKAFSISSDVANTWGTVSAKSATGFTLNCATYGVANAYVMWEAMN